MMTRLTLFYDSIGKEVYTNQSILDSKHDLAARERERERETGAGCKKRNSMPTNCNFGCKAEQESNTMTATKNPPTNYY